MSTVETFIYSQDQETQKILLYFHQLFTQEYGLTTKLSFGNPTYYGRSWICYLRPLKNQQVELAFLRGNELSNAQGLLSQKGRKQVMSMEIAHLAKIPLQELKEVLNEAILLDEVKPYASKRSTKNN